MANLAAVLRKSRNDYPRSVMLPSIERLVDERISTVNHMNKSHLPYCGALHEFTTPNKAVTAHT